MSDACTPQSLTHRHSDTLGEQFQLDNFGGDVHPAIMCDHAHLSMDFVCEDAESVLALLHAQRGAMGTLPKSDAVKAYRREIARYLQAVSIATGWKQVEMAERAGGMAHTTVGRAMKGENTFGYPALLALEEQSGVPIPDSLVAAARAAQQPTRREPDTSADELRSIAARLLEKPEQEREAMLRELRRLVKAR